MGNKKLVGKETMIRDTTKWISYEGKGERDKYKGKEEWGKGCMEIG